MNCARPLLKGYHCYSYNGIAHVDFPSLTAVLCVSCSVDEQNQSLSSNLSRRSAHDREDLGLTILAVLLSVLIAVIVLRKILVATGSGSDVGMDADMSSFE